MAVVEENVLSRIASYHQPDATIEFLASRRIETSIIRHKNQVFAPGQGHAYLNIDPNSSPCGSVDAA